MPPIKLLEKHLHTLERDLKKSEDLFNDAKIGKRTHELHYQNIAPQIAAYKIAIEKLSKP
ncbi:MAG: hypothetical protein WCJ95_09515 [Mariniphaga sp.]